MSSQNILGGIIMNRKFILLAIISLLSLGVFAGCTKDNQQTNNSGDSTEMTADQNKNKDTKKDEAKDTDKDMKKETLKVGTSGGYPPYTFVDDENNLTGFDVDVWNEIGKRLDMDVEFKTAAFSGLFGMLDNEQINTIANQITITDERAKKYTFTSPYVYNGAQLVVKEDSDITSLKDLVGKKVGVSLGSNYADIITTFSNNIEVVTYESYSGSVQDVALGRIDAVLNDALANKTFIDASELPLKLGGEVIEEVVNAFPFKMTETNRVLVDHINTAMKAMAEDGTLTEISLKYFPIDITKK